MQSDDDMPNWDVAISGMVEEEFRKTGQPLIMDDFKALAREYDFRLDDIMETVFLMMMHEAWAYSPAATDKRQLNHETLVEYCLKKRMSAEDLDAFDGSWQPRT